MNLKSLMKYQEVFLSFPELVEESFRTSATEVNYKLINEIEYQVIGRASTCYDSLNGILTACQSKLYEEKRKRNTYLVEGRSIATVKECVQEDVAVEDKILLLKDNQSTIEYQIFRIGLDKTFLDYEELLCVCLCEEVFRQKPQLMDLQINQKSVQHIIRLLVKHHKELYVERAKRELELHFLTPYVQITEQLIDELEKKSTFVFKTQYK